MEDFIEQCFEEPLVIDETYEFDAFSFFDFTRPESDSEIEEAERWFEISGDYPPSPFIVKLNFGKVFSVDVMHNSSNSKDSKKVKPMSNSSDVDGRYGACPSKKKTKGASGHIFLDSAKTKTKSATKLCQSRSSTLMRPIASHLAKQNKLEDTCSSCVRTRFQKNTVRVEEKITQSPLRFDNLATKRQKLEIGYLRKVAHLKHQISLVHKLTKKVTVPKEPELETLLRAQRRRSKNSSRSSEHEKPKASAFREHPLNRKILQAPSIPQPKKKTEFQEFHLKTMERAMQHASANVSKSHKAASRVRNGGADSKRPNSRETLKPEKHGTSLNSKSQKVFPNMPDDDLVQDVKQEFKIDYDNSLLQKLPSELFNKLSLQSDIETNKISQLKKHLSNKELKENVPGSSQTEFWKCHAKPNQCGGQIIVPETEGWSNNRRLGIS